MNTKERTVLQHMKAPSPRPPKRDKMMEMQVTKSEDDTKPTVRQPICSKERKLALQQDVDKLRKKLKYEENVHRALERAFNRPLGTLPRLPPYLPTNTLELLAEVAVLEEEVLRLEEQLVHFRKDLYQEAVYISSSKRKIENSPDAMSPRSNSNPKTEQSKFQSQATSCSTPSIIRCLKSLSADASTKDNHLLLSPGNSSGVSIAPKSQEAKASKRTQSISNGLSKKHLEPQKLQLECRVKVRENAEAKSTATCREKIILDDIPNRISEDILRCLSNIMLRKRSMKSRRSAENLPYLSTPMSREQNEDVEFGDPYGICSRYGKRDVGPYKDLISIDAGSINSNRTANYMFLEQRLKLLLGKLASVKLQNLTHQEKLAFWINIYNSCMMNAYHEYGIPESPHMVVALMQKATINVGGHLVNPITIEHFILRLPYHSKNTIPKGTKNDEMTARSIFGLELSEPLVTFSLSCGSWSSPAVRVYTASAVENQLESSKRDYLQAVVGFSSGKFIIPKLLDWYLLDFAKDLDSLLDWICLQLPSEIGKEAIKCLESRQGKPLSQFVQVMPYDFSFRYLLYTQ